MRDKTGVVACGALGTEKKTPLASRLFCHFSDGRKAREISTKRRGARDRRRRFDK
jgi:hypothetical protein